MWAGWDAGVFYADKSGFMPILLLKKCSNSAYAAVHEAYSEIKPGEMKHYPHHYMRKMAAA